ncbi:MAG: hypothetical protein AB1730_25955 [Myxococcota bacterium]
MRLRPLAVVVLLAASAASAASLTRGPYLQLAGPTGITIAFRTDAPAVARVRHRTAPRALTASVVDAAPGTQHVLELQGLTPATRDFYAADLDGVTVAMGGSLRFRSYPTPGTDEAFRLLAWCDSSTGNAAQLAVGATPDCGCAWSRAAWRSRSSPCDAAAATARLRHCAATTTGRRAAGDPRRRR